MIFDKIRERLIAKRDSICKTKNDCIALSDAEVNGVTFANFDDAINIINEIEAEYNQTVTNADIIRHMTDEELADFLFEVEYRRSVFGNGAKWKSEEDALKYLQEEVER